MPVNASAVRCCTFGMVVRRVGQQLRLSTQAAAPGQPFVLPEEILFRVKEVAAARYLVNAGVAGASAAHFAQALAQPVSNNSVSRWFAPREERRGSEEGIDILEGALGLWLLRPFVAEDVVRIRVSPVDVATARRQIATLFAGEARSTST